MTLLEFAEAMRKRGFAVKVVRLKTKRKFVLSDFIRRYTIRKHDPVTFPIFSDKDGWPNTFMGHPVKFVIAEELLKVAAEPSSDRVFRSQMNQHLNPSHTERSLIRLRGEAVSMGLLQLHCMTGAGLHENPTCHKHKCSKCGAVWIHENSIGGLSHRLWMRYHTCACGDRSELTKRAYSGSDEPTISHFPLPTAKDFNE